MSEPVPFEDINLTDNFTLAEMTRTDHAKFQEKNRLLTPEQIEKLRGTARLLEHVRYVLNVPITVLSGYRCKELNDAVGSTDRSQHLLCEAADIIPGKQDLGVAFRTLWHDMRDKGTNVGQLIYEKADRSYGPVEWIHISVGQPNRPKEKCGQVLRMTNGTYERLA
jgi:zinc D-Ala-D-Ala carboxypeptidase